ncbi:helix-turn-helix domain-containing protein [Ensifer soli]|uniref:helix-turn-helix domain-containing protein n=1 Tax=Ciceribacter sp. sgz301302 TaxID=3342379 RepID=UPI0035BAA139
MSPRPKQLLTTTMLSMSDVAGACGFNGASQFGKTFREFMGQTPLEFRRRA